LHLSLCLCAVFVHENFAIRKKDSATFWSRDAMLISGKGAFLTLAFLIAHSVKCLC